MRFEGIQIRQNTRTYTLKMHIPLQGRFLSLLKRKAARCTPEGANAPRGALGRKIEGMTPFVHQSNSLVTSGTKGSCTANRTFTDSRLYEFGTGSPLPSPASRTASLMVASWIAAFLYLRGKTSGLIILQHLLGLSLSGFLSSLYHTGSIYAICFCVIFSYKHLCSRTWVGKRFHECLFGHFLRCPA